jgi:hypothetical protein
MADPDGTPIPEGEECHSTETTGIEDRQHPAEKSQRWRTAVVTVSRWIVIGAVQFGLKEILDETLKHPF